ncbi:MAG: hydrolase [Neobacillus sp.]|nr:hydrolase [Neobacillus sp.]
MSIEQTVWSYLRNKGLPEKSAAAIMGNVYQESSFDPIKIEVGSGEGFGLFQWSFERKTAIKAYGTDLQHQLDFFWSELTGENKSATGATLQWITKTSISLDDFMKGNGSVDELTTAFCSSWERAGVPMMETRQSKANEYFSKYTGTSPSSDSANSSSDNITVEATNYQVIADSQKKGDVLFGRRYRITVSDSNGDGLDVSDLRCTFNITKTIQMEPNSSEITIYNLNAKTENSIMMNGKRVTVEAGYEGTQFGLIFDGDILQTIRERENGTTFKLTIIALDSDRAINFDIANFSLVKGQTARNIVEHIVNKAGNPIDIGSISEKLSGQKLTRGKVLFGKASDYLRQIAKSNELQYYMDDGRLHLISLDELPEGEIIELTPTSGLIGTPEQTDYGISGQCLLNPQIKLNSLIHIDNSTVRAKRIDINGSNAAPQGGTATDGSPITSNVRNTILAEAKKICDDPRTGYVWGGTGETVNGITGYDCSGFTQHCYTVAGLDINRTSQEQWAEIQADGVPNIDIKDAKAGDLVFWFNETGAFHVAIYAGNNDIYAASTSSKPLENQVAYNFIYGDYKIGRPDALIKADGGAFPSANNNTNNSDSQTLFRSLDKDGVYRCIKLTFTGDTRGEEWFLSFETIDQLGGAIATVSN